MGFKKGLGNGDYLGILECFGSTPWHHLSKISLGSCPKQTELQGHTDRDAKRLRMLIPLPGSVNQDRCFGILEQVHPSRPKKHPKGCPIIVIIIRNHGNHDRIIRVETIIYNLQEKPPAVLCSIRHPASSRDK